VLEAGDRDEGAADGHTEPVLRASQRDTREDRLCAGNLEDLRAFLCASRPWWTPGDRSGRVSEDVDGWLFENLPSERAIASRCADSLSIRGFLGYDLSDATPDHSSLSVIRGRLSAGQFDAMHLILLRGIARAWVAAGAQARHRLECDRSQRFLARARASQHRRELP
jgi:hypothetical protein